MMTVTVNGQAHQLPPQSTVLTLLTQLDLTGKRIAVELDGEIVPKSAHGTTLLSPDATLEIVIAVGGG